MLFVMNEALAESKSEATLVSQERRRRTKKNENPRGAPPLTSTPPSSHGLAVPRSRQSSEDYEDECDDSFNSATTWHSSRFVELQSSHDSHFDVEASEASSLMEDESLHDFFGESDTELTPTTTSRLKVSVLHSSLSALQNARSTCGMLHRQTSVSSLPITMDDSNRMRKRACTTTTTTTTSSSSTVLHNSSPALYASPCKALNWTAGSVRASDENKEVRLTALTLTQMRKPAPKTTTTTTTSTSTIRPNKTWTLPSYTLLFLIGLLFVTSGLYYHSHSSPYWYYITTHSRRAARQQPYLQLLLQQEGIDPQRLLDPSSPAFRALDWLANDDPMQLRHTHVTTQLLQRWALAVLYFATTTTTTTTTTTGSEEPAAVTTAWKNHTHWLSERPVCEWYGVHCEVLSQSDWFDATLGTADSHSDAIQVLGDPEPQDSNNDNHPNNPAMDVVRLDLANKMD